MEKTNVIVAPHPDDEIIGCYEVLVRDPSTTIIYGDPTDTNIRLQDMKTTRWFFPDPIYETHPLHRQIGFVGEMLLRKGGTTVIFYSINMRAPYVHEVKDPKAKLKMLNDKYPDKSSLWKYDHRYFIFEGYCQWRMIPCRD